MIDLSIIIISYNTKDITKKCIETVIDSLNLDSQIQTEIIVLDNASSDGSIEMLEEIQSASWRIKFKIIKSKNNLGFAKGNNEATKHAEGKVLLFLNSDTEVLDDAIPKLYRYFTSDDNRFHFVGGKLLNKDRSPQASAGPFFSLPIIFSFLFLRGDYWGLTRYSPDEIIQVDWISGACLMTRKEYFENLHGFDENIFMYMEEIDLLYRAREKKYLAGFYPQARFIHLEGASSSSRTGPIVRVYKGYLYFYKKHHSVLKYTFLKYMLQLKALIARTLGRLTHNQYLIKTYDQAYEVAKAA